MLNTLAGPEDRVTTAHRAKLAYIYVRQSTAGQVRQHQESTELNTGWSTGRSALAGQRSGSKSSMMTSASRGRRAKDAAAFSG